MRSLVNETPSDYPMKILNPIIVEPPDDVKVQVKVTVSDVTVEVTSVGVSGLYAAKIVAICEYAL